MNKHVLPTVAGIHQSLMAGALSVGADVARATSVNLIGNLLQTDRPIHLDDPFNNLLDNFVELDQV